LEKEPVVKYLFGFLILAGLVIGSVGCGGDTTPKASTPAPKAGGAAPGTAPKTADKAKGD
jgi:hypothetical protein